MWTVIPYVSTGLALVAFIVAAVAWIYKSKSEERERLIRTANPEKRAELVLAALEFFNVDTSGLTKDQRYELALAQIHARAHRFRTTAMGVVILASILAVVSAYAISESTRPSPSPSPRPKTVSIRVTLNGSSTERDITVPAGTMVTITAVTESPLREIYSLAVAASAPYPYTVLKSCDEGLECSIVEAKAGQSQTYYGSLGSIGGAVIANSDRKITVTWLPQ